MITDLRLQHFRSYKEASFKFSQGANIIVGPNASGKTNLLEAVLVLARGSSFRANDTELIQFKKPWARIDGHMADKSLRTVKLEAGGDRVGKTYELAGQPFKRLNLEHSLPTVLFEPNHLQLFVGGPDGRRDYLDDLLEQTTLGYPTLRRQYRRTLAQRNNLLKKTVGVSDTQIFPWNIRLSQLAGQVVRARAELAEKINHQLPKLYKELSKSHAKAAAEYASRWTPATYESHFLKKLENSLAEDIARGFTSHGPHREDLAVYLNGHPVQSAASRGEMRTAVLTLKIIELHLLEAMRDGPAPLLLLDDVFSELDITRRHALTAYIAPYQTFITTTDADSVAKTFTNQSSLIQLG